MDNDDLTSESNNFEFAKFYHFDQAESVRYARRNMLLGALLIYAIALLDLDKFNISIMSDIEVKLDSLTVILLIIFQAYLLLQHIIARSIYQKTWAEIRKFVSSGYTVAGSGFVVKFTYSIFPNLLAVGAILILFFERLMGWTLL